MSCEHAEGATLLWLYGELDPEAEAAHLAHVASCPACAEVVRTHEEVVSAVAPVAPALRQVAPAPAPIPAANRPLRVAVAALLLVGAAAVALAVAWYPPTASEPVPPADTDVAALAAPARDLPPFGDVDGAIDAVDLELAELRYDLSTL